ncbi:MAG: fasciclin domain-containing protein, partial [Ilumatobacteraceae bacterium]
ALDLTGLKTAVDECTDTEVTVFAPTNAAFAALFALLEIDPSTPEGVAALTALVEDGTIEDILLYHVLEGEVTSTDVLALDSPAEVEMLNGDMATVTHPPVKINDATVTTPDVQACNGVVHVIDKVLMPPADDDMGGDAGSGTTMAMLAAALLGAGLVVTTISRRRVTA